MTPDYYGPNVRVRFLDANAWEKGDDVIVERLDGQEWARVIGFSSMGDDFAYSNAKRSAEREQTRLANTESQCQPPEDASQPLRPRVSL